MKKRNLALEEKIFIFKTIRISKIVFQSFITTVPKDIINELEKLQKAFLWKNCAPKIKHETLRNYYKAGGLKNVDILNKIIALQCSWIRRLYSNSFHVWKLILLYLTEVLPIFLSMNYFVLEKTSCYDDWNTLLYSVLISVLQCEYPGR